MMRTYNVLIVEDEGLIANYIKSSIEEHEFSCVGIAPGYDEAIELLATKPIDVVLLDINLFGEKTGIDLAKEINKNYNIPFLYLTSYGDADTISKLKDTNPIGYISKPINPVDVVTTLSILCKRMCQKTTLQIGKTNYKLDISDLIYVKSDHVYLEFFYSSKKETKRTSLNTVLDLLPKNSLVQINRSIAVNPDKIKQIERHSVLLENNVEFKVSEKFRKNIS